MANGQQSTNNNTKDTRASDGKDKDSTKAPAAQQPKDQAPAPSKTGDASDKK